MKKNLYAVASAISLTIALGACSSDIESPITTNDDTVDVTLTASIANSISRAVGDGTNADQITYAIYTTDKNNKGVSPLAIFKESNNTVSQKTETLSSTSFELNVTLVRGEVYTVVFWADKKSVNDGWTNPYTFDATNKKISISYANALANDNNRDAFFGTATFTAGTDLNPKVELTRKFALVNLCATDLEDYKSVATNAPAKSHIKVVGAATSLNFFDDASDSSTATFALNTVPADNTPVSNTFYLGYALVLPAGSTADVSYGVTDGTNMSTITGIPVKANYQTNVQGGLLTSTSSVKASLAPAFVGKTNFMIWDGETVTKPKNISTENKEIVIESPDEFVGLIDLLNGKSSSGIRARSSDPIDYNDYKVTLDGDFDFNGKEIDMVGTASRNGKTINNKAFSGVFDGQGHTLKNFVIKHTENNGDAAVGFITALSGENAKICNLNFSEVKISSTSSEQVGLIGLIGNGAKVENVNVLSGTISGAESVGGIAGRLIKNGTIEGCTNNATINGKKNVGGIVGAAYYTEDTSSPMYLTNCTNSGDITGTGSNCVGGIAGLSCATVNGCTNTGIILHKTLGESVGGIVGEQQNAGSISKCTNSGSVTNEVDSYGTGGIVGWIRYSGATTNYPFKEIITVSDCENSGVITSSGHGAGGIVGIVYHWATVSGCTNTAATITGSYYVGGIVGGYQIGTAKPDGTTSFGDCQLTLSNNTTTTTKENLKGNETGLLLYDNTQGSNVTYSGNSPEKN